MHYVTTKFCEFCAEEFIPEMGPDGEPICEDYDGKLCCDDCLCAECGRGHHSAAERDECEQEIRFPDGPSYDTDALYEQGRDALCGVR